MRRLHSILTVFSLAAIAAPLHADEQSSAPSSTPTAEEKKICRSQMITGSRTARNRTCKTAAQWRESDREAREAGDSFQRARMRDPNN